MQEENYGRMNLASQTDENSVDAWDEAFEEELEEEPKEKKHLLKKSGQMAVSYTHLDVYKRQDVLPERMSGPRLP